MNQPAKLLYVITDSGVGGSEKVIHTLLSRINRRSFDPIGVVVLKKKQEMALLWESSGVPVFSLGMSKIPTISTLSTLHNLIKELKPDIVHSFLYHSCQLMRIIHIFDSSFHLITSPRVNYRFINRIFRWIDQKLKNQDDLAIAESSASAQFLELHMGYSGAKVTTIRNSVDSDRYAFNAGHRKKWREKWGISDEALVIGAAGRLHSQKGFDILLSSLVQLESTGPKYCLVIAGQGPEENKLKEYALAHQLPAKFLGLHTIMEEAYSAFDIFVQSSRYEGMSNALLEAMSVGLPCIATAVDGTMDIAVNDQNMILVKPMDSLGLSHAIHRLLGDQELRRSLSKCSREKAVEMSSLAMVNRFENSYHTILKG